MEKEWYGYQFIDQHKIVHIGVTKDPERREREHQLDYPYGHIKVSRLTTQKGAQEWVGEINDKN